MKKVKRKDREEIDTFYNIENTASATECTGIAPTVPDTEESAENIGELYAIHKPQPKKIDE